MKNEIKIKHEVTVNGDGEKREENTLLLFLGNLINLPFGLKEALIWITLGLVWSLTIIGIPFGFQCFKMAKLAIWPFGRRVVIQERTDTAIWANVLWFIFTGFFFSLIYFIQSIVFCVTIIGIPWGLQKFKLAKLALYPFGAELK